MIAGHFGFAAMVKSRERSTPLWALMLATVWLDIVFVPLFVAHLETAQPISPHAGYGGMIIHADYTHSIVGMLALSAALGAMFLPRLGRRSRQSSHWSARHTGCLTWLSIALTCLYSPETSATSHDSASDSGVIRQWRHVWNLFWLWQARSCTGAQRWRCRLERAEMED